MERKFDYLTPRWLGRAHIYHGELDAMRYRFAMDGKEKVIHAARYSKLCFELANDVEQQDFPWDEAGAAALGQWLQEGYEAFLAREGQP